jgi:hypothetical protein
MSRKQLMTLRLYGTPSFVVVDVAAAAVLSGIYENRQAVGLE